MSDRIYLSFIDRNKTNQGWVQSSFREETMMAKIKHKTHNHILLSHGYLNAQLKRTGHMEIEKRYSEIYLLKASQSKKAIWKDVT